MAPTQPTARSEREKKLKSVLTFASLLADRLGNLCDTSLIIDLQTHIRVLLLPALSTATTKQENLDKLGGELWNLSTRLRRDESTLDGKGNEEGARKSRVLCLVRVFAFLLLDSAGKQATKTLQRKTCIRLMKVALKAARVCIDGNELENATKVLERAAEYQEVLSHANNDVVSNEETELAERSRVEYYAVRTTLAWRQDRMDTAEHMFVKCQQLVRVLTPTTAENLADLLYEIGKGALTKRNYELAVRWLERAYDVLGEQDLEMLSPEAGELRLSTMQSLVHAHMKLKTPEAQDKAWHMVGLMETEYGDKMVVPLLKIELLSAAETFDTTEFYNVLLRMMRSVVLNDTNFRTIMHHIHKLKDHSIISACQALDDLVDIRLFREENQAWVEKAVITRVWLGTTNTFAENTLEQLQRLFDRVLQNSKTSLSAPATHAAQTLLWKQVEGTHSQEQYGVAEAWCRICLHMLFDKAGAQNKSKITRKIIQCALARLDFAAAREAYSKMPSTGKDEPVTRYLMYKLGIQSNDTDLAGECLDVICRNSSKDATLLYACVMEAQNAGDKRQAIIALERVLDKYDYSAPAGIHLPALLRSTARLLQSELVKDGNIDSDIMGQLCTVFEGSCSQARASRRRPSTPDQQLFTTQEFEWFSKNAYNLSLRHCAEMQPSMLVRLLTVCTEFIKLLNEQEKSDTGSDVSLRLVFCEFLATCSYTTMARAEDNVQNCLQFYLEARKHSQEFRRSAAEGMDKLGGSAQSDIILKHFQIVKLELEAVLKLEKWDELDDLFDQCWKYKSPDHYETLADLVLVIHSSMVTVSLEEKYRSRILSVLRKIIDLTWRQPGKDITKLARWIRCLFNIALTFDEKLSLGCVEKAIDIAAANQGTSYHITTSLMLDTPPPSSSPSKHEHDDVESTDDESKNTDRYPSTELEWLATTTYNRAIDYYMQENDQSSKTWAEHSFRAAQWLEDNGALRDLLMEKYACLNWNS
ncbi:SPO22-domain-containing protein [Dothidotthia symphoricarpi CBS 119687]|uniref:Protein ZIP4 homolog n=1 Tax=Dothidotthia symphoricarpi CBS 119687 TaxID=1392245 RepID=A0A6A6AHG9_9PLEO|nr:SPO22-domain-containing protein [Dothidotthia symphoricarpi CBS 119687]KAF2130996.1 SPO22-domain-containing protein [Dothidotthia symphoricarpi CBS 119687]